MTASAVKNGRPFTKRKSASRTPISIRAYVEPGSLPVGPRSHDWDKKQKKMILSLKFACNTDLGPKQLVARSVNYDFVLQNWPRVQIMVAVLFSENL